VTKTIMVIDDYEAIRKMIKKVVSCLIVSDLSYKTIEAEDGIDALQKLKNSSTPINLILCDINMPKMDGIEFLKTLNENDEYSEFKNIPIVMITSEISKEKTQTVKNLGVKEWIFKPFKLSELISVIEKTIG